MSAHGSSRPASRALSRLTPHSEYSFRSDSSVDRAIREREEKVALEQEEEEVEENDGLDHEERAVNAALLRKTARRLVRCHKELEVYSQVWDRLQKWKVRATHALDFFNPHHMWFSRRGICEGAQP